MSEASLLTTFSGSAAGREALRIVDELRRGGFVAVLAGGCVRDALLGRTPKDFDVATDAVPDAVRDLFGRRRTLAFGQSFGVIGVLPPRDADAESTDPSRDPVLPTEVATFRADGVYSDGRRPDSVHYGDALADALRRDFTINGLFYDPTNDRVIDHVGGVDDLKARRLRTIGDPEKRFGEDKLRLLRAIRFATTLDFDLDPATERSLVARANEIEQVSGERIGAEMRRVLTSPRGSVGIARLFATGLYRKVWPSLDRVDLERLAIVWPRLEPPTFESGVATVLLGHQPRSTSFARSALRDLIERWKLSTAERRAIEAALTLSPEIAQCQPWPWSRLQPLLVHPDIATIMNVTRAVDGETDGLLRAANELVRPMEKLDPPPLLTGDDLQRLGFQPGPQFKDWLASTRAAQLDGVIHSRDEAIAFLRSSSRR